MIKIIPVGMPKFSAEQAKKNLDKILKALTQRVRRSVQTATPVDSGAAKRSWSPPQKIQFETVDSSFPVQRRAVGYAFGNIQPYSRALEKGSQPGKRPWPSTGPRTTMFEGMIYSSQAPGGIFENADLEKVVERELPKIMEKLLSD
jgi:hypothetical protein